MLESNDLPNAITRALKETLNVDFTLKYQSFTTIDEDHSGVEGTHIIQLEVVR